MKSTYLTVALIWACSFSIFAQSGSLKTRMVDVNFGLKLRLGEVVPKGKVKGDILYFHGFGDRLDNHMPLFRAWADKGFRVISFDLPSHGESSGIFNNIDHHSFEEIIGHAKRLERLTRQDGDRPLILAGWSTGGLIAVRAAQKGSFSERGIEGLILFAPAVSVPALVGRKGLLTTESLTSNPRPPHMGAIKPISPLLKPVFAVNLLANAAASFIHSLPYDLPVLTMVAGDEEDQYVKSKKVKKWVEDQRLNSSAPRPAFQCRGAFHELDNEPGAVGKVVRKNAAEFAESILKGEESNRPLLTWPCERF